MYIHVYTCMQAFGPHELLMYMYNHIHVHCTCAFVHGSPVFEDTHFSSNAIPPAGSCDHDDPASVHLPEGDRQDEGTGLPGPVPGSEH